MRLFCQWVEAGLDRPLGRKSWQERGYSVPLRDRQRAPAIVVFAANDDNRRDLADQLTAAVKGRYPVVVKTPLGFFQDEVMLFWPLLIRRLNLRSQFPLRLRPETELELATQLWQTHLDNGSLQLPGVNDSAKVRRLLDLFQLAAVSGTPAEEITNILVEGTLEPEGTPELWQLVGQLLLNWQRWCLDRGLLTYGIISELYWRELLPDPTYQQYLTERYRAVLADNVDDYPAIARDLFDLLLDRGGVGAFTYNPDGQVRLGLNADPNYLAGLACRCQVETLTGQPNPSLGEELSGIAVELLDDPRLLSSLPESVQSIQTTSRAQLLRQTAQKIIEAVKSHQVEPAEIAIVAPGLDAIARYTLTEILSRQGIEVEPLNAQRPLNSSPMIRGLLTLLALVYPGLGRLVDRNAIAEMLVVLSRKPELSTETVDSPPLPTPHIDPVRAGLLADYCYSPDLEHPRLLPVESFARWDRLGYRATAAYSEIVQWLEVQREQQQQRLIASCVVVLDRAIQKFLWNGSNLPYDQLAALRELMETAQHYWEVDGRLRQITADGSTDEESTGSGENPLLIGVRKDTPPHTTIAQFIQLLRRGTITANPYPVRRLPTSAHNAVTLATIFQYRARRSCHRWHFWLDAGSPLWLSGGAATLFGAPLFLKEWSGHPWTESDRIEADEQRLQRILRDLLGRVSERLYLCHSDLAVNGTDQVGPLLTLVHAGVAVEPDVF